MKINVEVTVKPWVTPNFVQCEIGGKESSIPIAQAGDAVVRHLVRVWLSDVYAKAGMQPDWRFDDPAAQTSPCGATRKDAGRDL